MPRKSIEHGENGTITRRRAIRAAVAMGALGTAGCLGGDEDDQGGEEIDEEELEGANLELTGWAADDTESELLRELLDDFEDEYDIDVEYNPIPSEYQRQIQTQIGAGDVADVFYLDASYYPSFASEEVLLDLDQYLEGDDEFDLDDFFDPLIDAFRHEGTLYGIPKDFSTLALYHNTELLENAGVDEPPETWDELRRSLEAIQDAGDVTYPMMEYDDLRLFWAFLHQNGGQVLTNDGEECVIASDENVETLEYISGLLEDDLIGRPSEVGADWHGGAIGSEDVAMAVIGPWTLPALVNDHPNVDEKVDVAHLPIPEDGEQATAAYTVSYSSSTHTENPDAAYTLIRHLTSSEGMEAWARQGLALSARESHADLDYYEEHPRRRTHLEAGEWSHVVSFGPQSEEIMNRITPQLEGVATGEREPREALKSAEDAINDEVL